MDESGFTGEDLVGLSQPVFVHVATDLSREECSKLYLDLFSRMQADELKHKNLARRPSGRDRIVSFVKAIRSQKNRFTSWFAHKEFTLLTYLVDLWIEPAMHYDGVDLYKDGGNLALSNMIYYSLRSFQSETFLRGHLWRFQRMMVKRTPDAYRQFWGKLYEDYSHTDAKTRDILVFFLGAEMKLGFNHLGSIPERALDPALTSAVFTCVHWRKRTALPLHIVHDHSSQLAKDKWLWDIITSPKVDQRVVGIPGREFIYPLNVQKTEFADSRNFLQLQFCDLLAGASAVWARRFFPGQSHRSEYSEQLQDAGIEEFKIGAIWPEPEVDPEKLGMKGWSRAPTDFLTGQLAKIMKKPA